MKGLELAEKYYWEIGRPAFKSECPQLLPLMSAGLFGDGSECLGFDDTYSQDHDFGPGFCIWLSTKDFRKYGASLQSIYRKLPGSFAGYAGRSVSPYGTDRVGVMDMTEFFSRYIGTEQPPSSQIGWLTIPEYKLAAVTSGKLFEDPNGTFQNMLNHIAYYPEDVRIKKLAAKVAKMAQAGQYNYPRCMIRKDYVAAGFALQEFLTHSISAIYLLNRKYMPYYKWMYRGLKELTVLQKSVQPIEKLVLLPSQKDAWNEISSPFSSQVKDERITLIDYICDQISDELQNQHLIQKTDCYLNRYPQEIQDKILDPQLRSLHILID